MTLNQDIPDPWQTGEDKVPKKRRKRRNAEPGRATPTGFPAKTHKISQAMQQNRSPRSQTGTIETPEGKNSQPEISPQVETKARFRLNGYFWATLAVLVTGSIGFTATTKLLHLPAVPNCPKIYWPMASASMRLYCAEIAASKLTTEDLLEAIDLVESLPSDHPLRPEINRKVEEWSLEILKIGEQQFQEGFLDEAIATARKIPRHVKAYGLIEDKIEKWNSIWDEAEAIDAEVENQLRQSNWNQAFRVGVKLTNIGNRYWATVRYEEMVTKIQIAKEESSKLDKAFALLRRGGVDNLLEAIAQAEDISKESYAYQEAQNLLKKAGEKLIAIARQAIDNNNWSLVTQVAGKIPASLDLEDEVQDMKDLAVAGSNASSGTITSLEVAIASAQKIASGRPLYNKAQKLIARWQLEIEDVAHLERARALAASGEIGDLTTAIAEAQLIPRFNPRYQEAQQEIGRWRSQVQVKQDRPILERATQLATYGGIASLQDAVDEASKINSGRPLYSEAQEKVNQWNSRIQREQDRPFLDQAVALANAGNLPAAIDAAEQIRQGRALYNEAQGKISEWRREIQARDDLQRAYQIAIAETPDALVRAINTARQVPSSTKVSRQSRDAVERWSNRLLSLAQQQAGYDVKEAIAIAELVPQGTNAYQSARALIDDWTKVFEPPPLPPIPPQVSEPEPPPPPPPTYSTDAEQL
ncbi:MAG: chromosome segregation ATPase [Oscillatoria sp. PMC 1051.18]|nr:chromosome segregation ATPase [Oscillatoria sp. PMC 1050.18]MEC5028863.1 chromosome segregation ATPase [Oscillatoria sp. PMC 1051.18]